MVAKKFRLVVPVFAALIWLANHGCSFLGGNRVRVADTNFSDQIEVAQNLVFTFNKKCKPKNARAEWDTVKYLRFSPPTPGRFKWLSEDKLVFSPAAGFAPSANYAATLTRALDGPEGAPDLNQKISFHTPYLQLINVTAFWSKGSRPGKAVEARLDLRFNYAVEGAQVVSLLNISVNAQKTAFELIPGEQPNVVSLRLAEVVPTTEKALELKCTLAKGLRCAQSSFQTQEPIDYELVFPTAEKIEILSAAVDSDGTISVFTNMTPLADNLKSLVQLKRNGYYWEDPQYFTEFEVTPLENGFRLTGAFPPENYELRIDSTLKGIVGAPLGEVYTQSVGFQTNVKNLSFESDKGMYLAKSGARNVGVRLHNVEEVQVKIVKVFANNLIHLIKRNEWNFANNNNSVELYDIESLGDVVHEANYRAEELSKQDGVHLLKLDFEDKRKNYKGVYAIEVASSEEYYTRAAKIIAITDIGLIAKESENEITVFAHSLETAEPMGGANVRLISSNNQTVLQATTDGKGMAVFRDLKKRKDGFQVQMVSAELDKDFNFLHFNVNKIETSRFEVSGKTMAGRQFDAFLYGDRSLYRPGETLRVHSVTRTPDWKTVRGLPVTMRVLYPNGQLFRSVNGELNENGSFYAEFPTAINAPTGAYQAELRAGDETLIGSYTLSVEEFMPERIKLDLKLSKENISLGETVTARLQARRLFGPPAADAPYDVRLSLEPKAFDPPEYRNTFDFTLNAPSKGLPTLQRSGTTDAQGTAAETFELPREYADRGLLEGRLYASVLDENGRPVRRTAEFKVATQRVFYGLSKIDGYVRAQAPLPIKIVALNADGKAAPDAFARVRVYKYDWETVAERSDYRFRYVSKKNERLVSDKLLPVAAQGATFNFTPAFSGEYVVRVSRPGALSFVERRFYAYGWGMTQSNAFAVNTEGNVEITTDKSIYKTGEKAKVLFKTPFEGKLLVLVERDKVIDRYFINTDANAAELKIPLNDAHVPNVYVSATLLRPLDGAETPFTVAHGFQAIEVEKPGTRLPVSVSGPTQSRSLRELTYVVQTAPNAEVTVAAVDEGIVQIKDFITPQIYNYFYGKRALEVNPYDVYARLLPEIGKKPSWLAHSKTGGGGMESFEARANPFANPRVKPVAFWSGPRKADGAGRVVFRFNVPQFSGQVRVMAVAHKGAAFGSGEAFCIVADPIVVATGAPRFLSPGDTAIVTVALTNTTNRNAPANVRLLVSGAAGVAGAAVQNATLAPLGEARLQFKLFATQALGEAKIETKVQALGETFTEKIDISVRPATPYVRQNGGGSLAAGKSITLDLGGRDMTKGSLSARLTVSRSPLAEFTKDLNFLVEYPHGCLEQTISTAFPQLVFNDLTRALGQKRRSNPAANVQAAIQKVQSLQNYSGGLTYWPGMDDPDFWGSVYGLHFLYEAERAGYHVPAILTKNLRKYVKEKAAQGGEEEYYFGEGANQRLVKKEIPYALFVLTLCGEKTTASLNYYRGRANKILPEGRALLAAAYRLAGDEPGARAMSTTLTSAAYSARETGGCYASPMRDKALALYALAETEPNNGQIPTLVRQLSGMLKQEKYPNTQETAFALLALGKAVRGTNAGETSAKVVVDGKTVGVFDGKTLVLDKDITGKKATLAATGAGTLYYGWEVNGIPLTDYPEEDAFLSVRRNYFSLDGKPLSGILPQNEIIIVKLTVQALDGAALENVVITDLLPAGLEIENPRLGAMVAEETVSVSPYQYLDVRDDRIHFFANLSAGRQAHTFAYLARAVTAGTFKLGPASADAMYDGSYHSYHGGGTLVIRNARAEVVQ